ncbi:MAG: alpha/beta hydrolase [Acidimicrobiales bacterium]|jgi:acetyl esterase/lipase
MTEIREAISLWPGTPPGSEDWDQEEQEWKLPPPIDTTMVRNVVYPTITPVLPDNPVAARTGVVICPGGGYFMLATAHEGFDVAHWLADRGVAAFVLKYRVMETPAGDEEMATFLARGVASDRVDTSGPEAFLSEILTRMEAFASIPLADGVAALRLVQTQAHDWGVRADRVGAVGFSAGGRLVLDLALQEDATERPAFVGAIYAPTPERPVPADAPPLFLAAAADDPLFDGSIRAHAAWRQAGRPVEAHLYAKGAHGFGMRQQGLPADGWIEQFHSWMASEGFIGS